jgi:sulfate permease, SulP family
MTAKTERGRPARALPLLGGVLPIAGPQVPADIVAGITLAALAIPEVMGYTKIAGTPVITGLYTILIPMALFALFGSSRHLVVGADSATAAIMAAGLARLTMRGSAEYMAYAEVLAILAALFLIVARVIRLGLLADFLSRTVLIGFLTGVGIQVAISQVAGVLGLPSGGSTTLDGLVHDVRNLGRVNWPTLAISAAVLVTIVGLRKVNRKIPGPLIAVAGAIVLSYGVPLTTHGVTLLGTVPSGLPRIGLPEVHLDAQIVQQLLAIAFSMFIVILAQSAATSRAYAARYEERFSEDVDLVGLSLANLGAGLSGTFVVNGSPTKTQMVDRAGGRSQLAQITTAIVVLIVLLFLTGALSRLPNAVLAAVVLLIGVELIDVKGMRRILDERPVEFWVAMVTVFVVVLVGVEQGILLALVLSLAAHTRHGYRAKNSVLQARGGRVYPVPLEEAGHTLPGLVVYRFNHSMYYANAEQLSAEIRRLTKLGPQPVRWFCIDLVAVDDVDFSAAAVLREAGAALKKQRIRLTFADASDHVRHELDVSGVTDLVGPDAYHPDPQAVLETYPQEIGGGGKTT